VVVAGGPYSEAELRSRIQSHIAELLLSIDWRVLPEDRDQGRQARELFTGQIALELNGS
jgi:hypothetical protein